jgi:hypothetical protein
VILSSRCVSVFRSLLVMGARMSSSTAAIVKGPSRFAIYDRRNLRPHGDKGHGAPWRTDTTSVPQRGRGIRWNQRRDRGCPAETRPEGFAPAVVMPLVNTDRLVSSRRYLMVHQRCRQARTTVCMFGFLKPSDRSSGLRSFRTLRSRPQRKPVRFTSYAATTRMRRSRSNVLHSAH